MKKLLCILLALCLMAGLCGCGDVLPDQTVTSGELTITLPGLFQDFSSDSVADGLAFNYASVKTGVCAVKEDKATLLELIPDLDAKGYADLFVESNSLNSSVEIVDGIPSFTYSIGGATNVTYLCGVFESGTNFWVVQAYCEKDDYADCSEDMWSYIKTVTVE